MNKLWTDRLNAAGFAAVLVAVPLAFGCWLDYVLTRNEKRERHKP